MKTEYLEGERLKIEYLKVCKQAVGFRAINRFSLRAEEHLERAGHIGMQHLVLCWMNVLAEVY